MTTLDLVVVICYFILVAGMGIVLGRCVRNTRDYFSGNRSVPWFMGGISTYMTMMSTFVFVAYAGIAYRDGLVALTILWSTTVASIFASIFFAPRWKRVDIRTPTEYLEVRYNSAVRQTVSWGGVGFRLLDNMVRLYAMGLFISGISGFSLEQTILITGVVVLIYTMVGGLWAVILTDAIQCVILVLVTLILIPLTLNAVDGLSGLYSAIPDHFTLNNGPKGSFFFLSVYYLMILVKYNGNWAFIQRFYSSQSEADARKMGLFSAFLFFVLPVIFLFPAFAAPCILPDLNNPETAYVSVCRQLLPSGIMGIMVAAMFAATMSTLSAEYNVTASVLTGDIYKRLFRKNAQERELLFIGRLMTVLVGGIVMVGSIFVGHFGGAFEANKLLTGLIGVPLVVPLVFGVLWKTPTPLAGMIAIFSGILAGTVLLQFDSLSWETATLIQMIWTVLILFLVGYFFPVQKTEYRNRITAFFLRLSQNSEKNGDPATSSDPSVHPNLDTGSDHENNVDDKDIREKTGNFVQDVFATALVACSLLFMFTGILNIALFGGRLSLVAGFICLIFALSQYRWKRIFRKK